MWGFFLHPLHPIIFKKHFPTKLPCFSEDKLLPLFIVYFLSNHIKAAATFYPIKKTLKTKVTCGGELANSNMLFIVCDNAQFDSQGNHPDICPLNMLKATKYIYINEFNYMY